MVREMRGWFRRAGAFVRRGALAREIDEEFQFHIDLEIEDRIRSGMTRSEARRTALRDFGGVDRYVEEARVVRGMLWLDHLTRDLRQAVRALLRAPGFTLITVLTLALGIGANTAMFSVLNAVLLRPLPFHDPGRVALVWRSSPSRDLHNLPVSYADYEQWRAQSHQFTDLAIWNRSSVTVLSDGDSERLTSEFASANLFPMLAVNPAVGRFFTADEEQRKEQVALISFGVWQRRFGGRADVLGKEMTLTGDPNSWKRGARTVRIVGVMPRGFHFPDQDVDLWEPAGTYWRYERERNDRAITTWSVAGRLAADASVASARLELSAITERLQAARPVADQAYVSDVNVVPVLDHVTGKGLQLAVWMLLGAVSFVLLIACANVANLLLAHGTGRQREFATRTALGASRGRLLGQLLAETGVLVTAAMVPALALAALGVRALPRLAPGDLPRIDEVQLDARVLWFAVAVSLLTGLICGLAPAWKLSRTNAREAMSEAGHGSAGGLRLARARGLLIIAECALSIALLTGAGLLFRSLQKVRALDLGFQPENRLLVRVAPPPNLEGEGWARVEGWGLELIERIEALPGVLSAASTTHLLLDGDPDQMVEVDGRLTPATAAGVNVATAAVTPGFFETLGVPLVRGRDLTQADMFSSYQALDRDRPVLVNETFARLFLAGRDPLGRRMRLGPPGNKEMWLTVVGVVGDMRRQLPERPPVPEIISSSFSHQINELIVRTSGDPLPVAPAVRQLLRSIAPTATILSTTTVMRHTDELSAERRLQTWLLGLFALIALLLAALGIYGVMHYTVAQRKRELSIRVALGAHARDMLTLVVSQGMRWALVGVAIGSLLAISLTRVIAHLLFGVSAADPVTFLAVSGILVCTALLACALPAARAARAEPMAALKAE